MEKQIIQSSRRLITLMLLGVFPVATGFVVPSSSTPCYNNIEREMQSTVTSKNFISSSSSLYHNFILKSSNTLESPPTISNNTSSIIEPLAGTWECNEEAECVQVPECNDEECRTSLDVRIHGEWYDLTGTFSSVYFFGDFLF